MKSIFHRHIVIVCIILLQYQYCSGYDFLCSGSWINSPEDKSVFIYPENYDDIERTLPVYNFNNDKVGCFLHELTDSLVAINRRFPFWTISESVVNTEPKRELNDVSMLIKPASLSRTLLEKCSGIIISSQGKFGLLFDNSDKWIDQLHISKSETSLTIRSGKSYKNNLSVIRMLNSLDVWSLVKIRNNNQIDLLMLYNVMTPLYEEPQFIDRFKWLTKYISDYDSSQPKVYFRKFELPKTVVEKLYYDTTVH